MKPAFDAHLGGRNSDGPGLGWGIVGTGIIADHFASDLMHVEGLHLRGVVSRSVANAARFATQHGGTAYPDLASMLGDAAAGAVYVASPNDSHYRIAHSALAAGKSVLVEKPMAITSADVAQLAAFAAERRLFLMEGMWTRFLPAMDFVRRTVEAGAIGKVRHLRGELAFTRRYAPDSRFFDPLRGGGALLDLGVYLISLSLAFLGRPSDVRGNWTSAPNGVDLSAEIELDFGNARADLSCGFDRDGANLFVVEGSQGCLVLQPPFIGTRMIVETRHGAAYRLATIPGTSVAARAMRKAVRKVPLPGLRRHGFPYPGYGLHFEIAAAAKAIADGSIEPLLAPLSDTAKTLSVIEEVLSNPPIAR